MASNTPNLDLLKKDPVTDGNDTFNIETMLNENWDKIDAAVGQLEEDMQEIDIPLSDETNGTRSNVAGSEKAVGLVMQAANAANLAAGAAQTKADQAFTAGNERKAEVVAALVALGVSASTSDSWDTLISKMSAIIKATGNATAADLLAGKTASNVNGPITGTMPNRGAVSQTITTQNGEYTVPQGYHPGTGKVKATFANLVAGNVKSGVDIGGVVGNLEPSVYGYADVNVSFEGGLVRPKSSVRLDALTIPKGARFVAFKGSINVRTYDVSGCFAKAMIEDHAGHVTEIIRASYSTGWQWVNLLNVNFTSREMHLISGSGIPTVGFWSAFVVGGPYKVYLALDNDTDGSETFPVQSYNSIQGRFYYF